LACTIYLGLSQPYHCSPGQTPPVTLYNSDIRTIYTVRVPPGAVFAPHTINGGISTDLPDSEISATTVNGQLF